MSYAMSFRVLRITSCSLTTVLCEWLIVCLEVVVHSIMPWTWAQSCHEHNDVGQGPYRRPDRLWSRLLPSPAVEAISFSGIWVTLCASAGRIIRELVSVSSLIFVSCRQYNVVSFLAALSESFQLPCCSDLYYWHQRTEGALSSAYQTKEKSPSVSNSRYSFPVTKYLQKPCGGLQLSFFF